jgi:SAM-dependent methyltransferase
MKEIFKEASQVKKTSKGTVLEKKTGEGSFVSLERTHKTPEAQVQWLNHLYAYKYAMRFAQNNFILDIGCGTGYGIPELSTKAYDTVGIDIQREAVRDCHLEYSAKSSFSVASGDNLPFKNDSFDLVVSFQVIEHIHPDAVLNYLKEIKRVMKHDGILIVSTPNKRLRLLPLQKPWNPEHKKEYNAKELDRLLKGIFEEVKILGLSATRDAYLVEYNRVKPSPLHVYVIEPAVSALNRILSKSFIIKLKKVRAGKKLTKNQELDANYKFSLGDFQLSEKNLDASIDIYGICTKIEVTGRERVVGAR